MEKDYGKTYVKLNKIIGSYGRDRKIIDIHFMIQMMNL